MPANTHSSVLNDALVRLNRSLLQYTAEISPWADREAAGEQAVIDSLVHRQRTHVAALVDLLLKRYEDPKFGVFPVEYTDLHYVSLDYLLTLLSDSEQDVLDELERTLTVCGNDAQAVRVLEQARADQRQIVEQLKHLAEARTTTSGSLV